LSTAVAALAAVVTASLAASASAAQPPPIAHTGRWLTDTSGRVLIVHGFNMVYKVAPYYPAAAGFGAPDAALLQHLGFNVVRVGVVWKAVEPNPGVYDDRYLAQIKATVRALAGKGVYSLLDFHQDLYNERFQGEGAPDWAVQDGALQNPSDGFPLNYVENPALQHALDQFWANAPGPGGVGLQDRYAAAWRHVAQMFRGVPAVLGYELLNEPAAGTEFSTCLGGCPGFDARLAAFDRRVAKAIRTVDKQTLIFTEPEVGFDFGAPTTVPALNDGPAGFAFHDYCLVGSATGCPSEPRGFANALAHVSRTHEALLLTEWGSNPFPGDLGGMIGLADRNMVPWIEWSFCPCNDPTGATPDPLVLDPSKPPIGSNLGQLALSTLVEAFPHVISGTPLSWGFDRQTKTFRLRYSTARVDGHGRFAASAVTGIATPPIIYGGHYAVHVHGGAILTRHGAPTLEIAACPGARTISIEVLDSGRNRESCRAR
jgi:endoglycosylceramidase